MVSPLGKVPEGGPSSWVRDVGIIWIFSSQFLEKYPRVVETFIQKWKIILIFLVDRSLENITSTRCKF